MAPLQVRQCRQCEHLFLTPYPSDVELEKFYGEAEGYTPEAFSVMHKSEVAAQYDHSLDSFGTLLTGTSRSLFDFGCARGAFITRAKARGWKVAGYEPTERLADAARELGVGPIYSNRVLEDVSVENASIDVVHCAHVLEHLADPLHAIRWMSRVLKPGGILSVQVPNQFDDALWPILHRRRINRTKHLGYNVHHLQFFTLRSLRAAVEPHGLSIVEMSTRFWLRNRRGLVLEGGGVISHLKLAIYLGVGLIGRGPQIDLLARRLP